MSFNVISFLKSSLANRGAVPVADDNPLPVTGGSYTSAVALARTADTVPYTAGDVLGIDNAGSAGAAALTFANIGPALGGEILITSGSLLVPLSAVPSGMGVFRQHFYSVTPPSALLDNAAWDLPAGDRASYLGFIDYGTPVDLGSTLYVEAGTLNKQIAVPVGGTLYGYLQTIGGYTPASGTVYTIKLHATGF